MRLPRSASLMLLVVSATAWSGALVVAGLWLLAHGIGPARAGGGPGWPAWVIGGIAAMAAGQFVFMTGVADRLIPNVGRRPGVWLLEMALFAVFVLAVVVSAKLFASQIGVLP